jgi:transcriptional regulator with XRE-family HTH domain
VRVLLSAAKDSGQQISQKIIAKAAGISPRTLAHHLSIDAEDKSAPTLRTVQAVANAFGLEPWLLLTEDLSAEIALSPHMRETVQQTISLYLDAPPEAKEAIDKMAHLLPRRIA